ncbi:hypothetical protein I3843_04G172400 [Carya illinoinensis]|nr:hypothetical protein I3843_04G172400 [Carya illinoinensis]
MSMGLLVDTDAAFVWRGPMVGNALGKMVRDVNWGTLDILLVDMPPGTGDAQIAISQLVHLSGALIVSDSSGCGIMDARRGVKMSPKSKFPEPSFIFGKGGTRKLAAEMGLECVGEIPLEVEIRKGSDEVFPSLYRRLILQSPKHMVVWPKCY